MDLAPDARDFAHWNYVADFDPTLATVEVSIDGVWYPASSFTVEVSQCRPGVNQWTGVVLLLVAGPLAVANPPGTVVLGYGNHPAEVRFTLSPKIVVLDGGSIEVITAGLGMASGPCAGWEPDACVVFPDCTQMVSGYALEAATEVLWNKTARRFGVCEVAYRPCRTGCDSAWWASPAWGSIGWGGGGYGWPYPALVGGRWFNLGCGFCGDSCSCTVLHQIVLPSPVAGITAVKVDGVVLAPSAYRVDDWDKLVRLDGEAWPLCNDLNLPDTEPGTWSVTAVYGEAVPALGRLAVGELALHLVAGLCAATGCRTHAATVKEITRQGVRKQFFSADSPSGQIGLYLSDLFVSTFNPARSSPAAIYDMDRPHYRRVGTS